MEMLGKPLEENHLSVFAPRQEWSLHGDSILPNVEYNQAPGADDIYWAPGIGRERSSITDYTKLDLALISPNSVSWTINLPANLQHADFESAVAWIPPSWSELSQVSCNVSVRSPGEAECIAYSRRLVPRGSWRNDFRIPLDSYVGKTITIRLSAEGKRRRALPDVSISKHRIVS